MFYVNSLYLCHQITYVIKCPYSLRLQAGSRMQKNYTGTSYIRLPIEHQNCSSTEYEILPLALSYIECFRREWKAKPFSKQEGNFECKAGICGFLPLLHFVLWFTFPLSWLAVLKLLVFSVLWSRKKPNTQNWYWWTLQLIKCYIHSCFFYGNCHKISHCCGMVEGTVSLLF